MKNLLVLIVLSIFGANAMAMPPYLAKFKTTYPNAKKFHNCQTCHGKNDENDYGKDFGHNNHDFKAIEEFDSDADGFTNIVEINAGTQPGNKDSHPAL